MIRLKSLVLKNYRMFSDLKIDFSDDVTCLVGINGTGKTSILNALALCFSWIIARARSNTAKGSFANASMDLRVILDERSNALEQMNATLLGLIQEGLIDGKFSFDDKDIEIRHSFSRLGVKKENASDYSSLAAISDYVNENVKARPNSFSLPVLVYYPTNRSVLDIPMRIRMQHVFNQFSTYENSLDANTRFRDFFEWYRDREDYENAKKSELRDLDFVDGILECVRRAIYGFLPGYENLHIQRAPLLMTIQKNGLKLPINVLSDGEKCLLSLAGDLARRLAIANPSMENPLEGSGIVLIDEIDLHLHPSWQRKVVHLLKKTFPNCQFIITTHSPQVLGEIKPECIRVLKNSDVYAVKQSFGLSSESVLNNIMAENNENLSINAEINQRINDVSALIDNENFTDAKKQIDQLEEELNGHTPETIRLSSLIDFLDA